jgi:hypothetical protein
MPGAPRTPGHKIRGSNGEKFGSHPKSCKPDSMEFTAGSQIPARAETECHTFCAVTKARSVERA